MPNVDLLTYGFSLSSDQGSFGFSTVTLVTVDDRRILVDTGPSSRRAILCKTLADRGIDLEDIDTVILTHLHWDHCQNIDLFPNARILVHPKEIDYLKHPFRGDHNVASYFEDVLSKLRVEPISEGTKIAKDVSVIDTPGHTKGHISVLISVEGNNLLIAGDALPDGGTIRRRLPYNVFWDVDDATESVEKIVASAEIFYPGHDKPFALSGEQIIYLPDNFDIEISSFLEAHPVNSITYKVHSHRDPNIEIVQK